jgi:hypothetical protein
MIQPLVIYDIETRPRPEDQLRAVMPTFEAPSNYKDPDKIAEAKSNQRRTWLGNAAKSPLTGEVFAIGLRTVNLTKLTLADLVGDSNASGPQHIHVASGQPSTEKDLLAVICRVIDSAGQGAHFKLVGWNNHDFDNQFIVRRLMFHGMKVPAGMLPNGHSRFYWPPWLLDLRQVWAAGEYPQPAGNLATVGAFLGLGTYESSGEHFARLWDDPATRPEAIAHLSTQLQICARMAERFGLTERK